MILCRNNIRTGVNDYKVYNDIENDTKYRCYRYGFHIYFFDCVFNIDGKNYIKNNFNFSKKL